MRAVSRRANGSVAVRVFSTSDVAPAASPAWSRLDEFEGAEYRRVLVPVLRPDGRALDTVANVYVAR